MTNEQARVLTRRERVHENGVHRTNGSCYEWRVTSKVRLWVRQPKRFEVSLMYGMRGHFVLNEGNAEMFHMAQECPSAKVFCWGCGFAHTASYGECVWDKEAY